MKTILAYGDSLTWGYDPDGPCRHALADRWPSVLEKALGGKAQVIAEGLNGRTTAFDDHVGPADRNGARLLPSLLTTHAPVDLVIIMLGTNDMKPFLAGAAIAAKQGMERLVDIVRGHAWPLDQETPEILIVAPPAIRETGDPDFAALFAGAIQQSHMLGSLYADLADVAGCGFFDAGSVAETSPLDGVHLDAANTRAIGRGLEPLVRMMLGL
ncbi:MULTISPECIES: SGNH/GDSL hydrolase family protein [Nitratireductor]|uniref:SGNH/GDSL hydrolase family protein n=1 Tax=Nitratireductor TaxID=245876 RepID=UPI000D0CC151|nr:MULTISPECIES: SGNH/GDSL hydrolase family protein [Nitratireductor]PSM19902.1 arylesterase [Nitratireductor sp. StC3]